MHCTVPANDPRSTAPPLRGHDSLGFTPNSSSSQIPGISLKHSTDATFLIGADELSSTRRSAQSSRSVHTSGQLDVGIDTIVHDGMLQSGRPDFASFSPDTSPGSELEDALEPFGRTGVCIGAKAMAHILAFTEGARFMLVSSENSSARLPNGPRGNSSLRKDCVMFHHAWPDDGARSSVTQSSRVPQRWLPRSRIRIPIGALDAATEVGR